MASTVSFFITIVQFCFSFGEGRSFFPGFVVVVFNKDQVINSLVFAYAQVGAVWSAVLEEPLVENIVVSENVLNSFVTNTFASEDFGLGFTDSGEVINTVGTSVEKVISTFLEATSECDCCKG